MTRRDPRPIRYRNPQKAQPPHRFNISITTPDARALLALLNTSATFPDVVAALEEKLDPPLTDTIFQTEVTK